MKSPKTSSRKQGFTLVELLTVIAVIGILAAILIPTIGAVQRTAQMALSSSNLKQIATSYQTYSTSGSRARSIPSATATVHEWAGILAENVGLNDPSLYYIDVSDDVAEFADYEQLSVIWAGTAIDGTFDGSPVSYAVAAGLSLSSPATQTPLIWTKELGTDGIWPTTSPWGSNEGHIAFLDSHVTKYTGNASTAAVNLVNHPQVNANGGTTASIQDAIGNATILESTN